MRKQGWWEVRVPLPGFLVLCSVLALGNCIHWVCSVHGIRQELLGSHSFARTEVQAASSTGGSEKQQARGIWYQSKKQNR